MKHKSAEYQRAVAQMIDREVYANVSGLITTLAPGFGTTLNPAHEIEGATEIYSVFSQAWELAYPIEDYEGAAQEAGWEHGGDGAGFWFHKPTWGSWKSAASWSGTNEEPDGPDDNSTLYDTAEEVCNGENIEPQQREVYEHWIVSPWLADKLEAKGEKVDRDFAGLTIWARTCTGQAIALDSVICEVFDESRAA